MSPSPYATRLNWTAAGKGFFRLIPGRPIASSPDSTLKPLASSPKASGHMNWPMALRSHWISRDIAVGRIEFMGEFVGGTLIFGGADAEPLLGVTALEPFGIEVDPLNQRLKRLPAVRLKSLRNR